MAIHMHICYGWMEHNRCSSLGGLERTRSSPRTCIVVRTKLHQLTPMRIKLESNLTERL